MARPEDVIVVQTDGTKLVVVQRTDLDLESADPEVRAKAEKAAIYDNRPASLTWIGSGPFSRRVTAILGLEGMLTRGSFSPRAK